MTGIRSYTSLDPNIWRFPQWKENVYYPAGSFVGVPVYNPLDSESPIFTYYVSLQDIPTDHVTPGAPVSRSGELSPADSDSDWQNHTTFAAKPWVVAFDTQQSQLDNTLLLQVLALTPLLALLGIDSDIAYLYRNDSDLRVKDSELDSDIVKTMHDAYASDSDYDSEIRRLLDSEIHDRKAADSDLRVRDSELDSDIRMEIHDRMAADSDIAEMLIRLDSELDSEIHDRKAADSDILEIIKDLDSEIDSEIRILHRNADSDSDRLTNFIHRYEERDSDIEVKFTEHDSDIQYLYNNAGSGTGGFPVGSIVAFASTAMPRGFYLCNGQSFNQFAYPKLFTILGEARVPDLRNQFLRGWNNDSDGFGGARGVLSTQEQAVGDFTANIDGTGQVRSASNNTSGGGGPTHITNNGGDGGNNAAYALTFDINNAVIDSTGEETRPDNTAVVYGIAMYDGAGIIYDSEVVESIVQIMLADRDSDINMLLNRTNYHSDVYAPGVDIASGGTYDTGVSSTFFDDITVLLNGVQVTQWTVAGSIFTLNFALRGNQDVVTFKMRR